MFKKIDWFVIFVVFFVAIIGFSVNTFSFDKTSSTVLNIYIEGEKKYSYDLPVKNEQIVEINNKLGYNKIVINKSGAYVENSDCKNKYCVKTGVIKNNGDFIICAPHKIIVKIEKQKGDSEFNAVSY